MAIPMILSKNGVTIYPATIPQAIIDPETGLPAQLGGANVEYTINNQFADENGNFTITASGLGAAAVGHKHDVADINDLENTLAAKADSNHTHDVVQSLIVNGSSITGNIRILGTGNVTASSSGDVITISITPYTTDLAQTMYDTAPDAAAFKVFVGTEEEWENFKNSIPNGQRYMVYIRS